MTVRTPDPLPEWAAKFVLPDGRLSDDFYRYLWDADKVIRAAVEVVNEPDPIPEAEIIEEWPVFIAFPANKDYRLVLKATEERTVTEVVTRCASGTCTATVKIDTTALGGTANSVSSSEQSQTHSTSNTWGVGQDLVLTVSSNSSCVDMSLTVKTTRTVVTTS